MPLPKPAPSCTITWCPAVTSAWTEAGVIPTRYSWFLTSVGIPISTLCFPRFGWSLLVCALSLRAARLPALLSRHLDPTLEERPFGDDDPRRGDVPFEASRRRHLYTVAGPDVPHHPAAHAHHRRADPPLDRAVSPDHHEGFDADLALDLALDQELGGPGDRALHQGTRGDVGQAALLGRAGGGRLGRAAGGGGGRRTIFAAKDRHNPFLRQTRRGA